MLLYTKVDMNMNNGMGKVVAAAYRHWSKKDWVVHHAIAASFTGQNDEYLFD